MAKKKQGPLSFDREFYSASMSEMMFTEQEARAEYVRLRRLANKRLAALERAGLGESRVLQYYPREFGSLRGRPISEVRKALQDVAHFVSLKTTTIRGIRKSQKKALASFHKHGFDFINQNNIDDWGRFIEAAKRHTVNLNTFDSNAVYDFFKEHNEDLPDPEDYEDYYEEYQDIIENYEPEAPDESERVKPPKQQPSKAPKQLPKKRQPARKKREQRPSERWKERAAKKTGRRYRRR